MITIGLVDHPAAANLHGGASGPMVLGERRGTVITLPGEGLDGHRFLVGAGIQHGPIVLGDSEISPANGP